ncbi:hypothetical protein KIPB_013685, partial [Kipferlia bialata]|eukprot:g13685.t1
MGDIEYHSQAVGHKYKYWGALAYLGPLGEDGRSPAACLKEGEKRMALIVGPNDCNPQNNCMIVTLDFKSRKLSSEAVSCPIDPHREFLTGTRLGERVYVFGGRYPASDDLYCYTITSKSWRKVSKKGRWPPPRCEHVSFTLEGKLYIAGGYPSFKDCWCLDPETETWTQLADAPVDRYFFFSGAAVVGDTAHIVGGCHGTMHLTFTAQGVWGKETPIPSG